MKTFGQWLYDHCHCRDFTEQTGKYLVKILSRKMVHLQKGFDFEIITQIIHRVTFQMNRRNGSDHLENGEQDSVSKYGWKMIPDFQIYLLQILQNCILIPAHRILLIWMAKKVFCKWRERLEMGERGWETTRRKMWILESGF